MKKRILFVWFLIILLLGNSICAFAAEYTDNGEVSSEDTIVDEDSYPFQSFADMSTPGISIEGSADEGVFPSGTTMEVIPVSSDIKERIKDATNEFFSGNQKAVELIAVDISFFNNDEKINPKEGKTVNLIIRSDIVVEGKKHIVACFKDNKSLEIIPATETILKESISDQDLTNQKKEISFDIKESSIYAIIEIEDIVSSTITDTTEIDKNEVDETEKSVNQNEENGIETSATQNEAEETEIPTEQKEKDESETLTEQKETDKSEISAEQKEKDKSKTPAEQKDTKKSENPNKQKNDKETKTSVEQNEKTKVLVEIKWDDVDNQDGIRPEEITIYLLSNGNKIDAASITEKSQWKHSFESLPEYESEKKITYTIEVGTLEGYTTTIDGFTIKNTHKPSTTSIEGKLVWDDEKDHDSIRPESVSIKLLTNGKKVEETSVTEKDEWKYSFEDLPKFRSGKEIVYTIEQNKIKGYKTKNRGFDVINTHALETIMVEGVKMWDDESNKDGIRPTFITVNLIVDGNTIDTATVSKKSDWKYSFGPFPKYELGKEIVYKIEEVPVEGYTTEYYGFNITNIHKAGTVNKSESDSHSNRTPKVGDSNNILLWIIVVILCITLIFGIIVFRRKK